MARKGRTDTEIERRVAARMAETARRMQKYVEDHPPKGMKLAGENEHRDLENIHQQEQDYWGQRLNHYKERAQ